MKIEKISKFIQNAELADFAPKMYDWYEKSGIKSDPILQAMMKSEKEQGDSLLTAFKKQWFGKIGASYAPNKGTEIGLYYSHKSLNFFDGSLMGGMEMSAPSASGYDFVSLDFVCKY